MAIIRSNGILFVDSIPTHTPTGNQARMAFMQDLSQWWVWNGTIWHEMSLIWDIVNAATYILDDTVDIQVQEGGIGRIWRSLGGGGDQEYIEFGADGLKIVQIVGGVEKHIKMLGTTLELYNESGEYKIGDNAFFPLPTDEDADYNMVLDSATSLLGKAVRPKVMVLKCGQSGTNPPTVNKVYDNFGGTLTTHTYSAPGYYYINFTSPIFDVNKAIATYSLAHNTNALSLGMTIYSDQIYIHAEDSAGDVNISGDFSIHIIQYP